MPYVISGNVDDSRVVAPEFNTKLVREFFFPISSGQEITSEILSRMPDPYFVKGPKMGEVPAIFEGPTFTWNLDAVVKALIEDLEPGITRSCL
jgi:hypothetical protein